MLAAIWSSWNKESGACQGDRVSSRIERLERLDELRRIGALTDAEYEQEKAKASNGFSGRSSEPAIEPPGSVESSAHNGGELTGVRAHWANSSIGRNKPLALAAVVVSTLIVGVLTHSLLVAGVWLAVCSAGAYWLYTGLRIEQKPEHEEGTAAWRVFFYVGCGAILLGFVGPRITGGRSGLDGSSTATESAVDKDAGTVSSGEEQQVSEAPSAGAGSRMSCRSAMEIAAVASCGIQIERLKGGNLLFGSGYRPQVEGYQRSLQQVSPPLNSLCGDAVNTGTNAATEGIGDAWDALTSQQVDTRTAVRMCAMGAKPRMDEFCEYNGASCS